MMAAIETVDDLRALYGHPKGRTVDKVLPRLDRHCRRFISMSPFALLATTGADGSVDVSPRGDGPGFVAVEEDGAVLLPDRPGNNRLDSLVNILERPRVGLLFLIPGVDESLRVNGCASIEADRELTARFAVDGRAPRTVLRVEVEEAFLHCAKALMRSKLWSAEAQVERSVLPTMGEMLRDQTDGSGEAESQQAMVARYAALLY